MSKNTLTLPEQKNVITKYLNGAKPSKLATEYDVTTKTIKDVVSNKDLRTDVERKHIELTASRESRKIDNIKDQMLKFISTAITEAMDEDKKIVFMDKISKMISDLDRISRLNREQNTSNDTLTTKNVKIDVANIISQLQTPDQKRAFLRQQLVVEGEVTE